MSADKDGARKAAFIRRRAAHAQGLDGRAQERLQAFLEPHRGRPLAGYVPIGTEVNPLPVMAAWPVTVGVPVIPGKDQPLVFHQWTSATRMIEGAFGAEIPKDGTPMTPEVLIVPLVAYDEAGNRLGYGGGFYDRTLEALRARGPVLAVGFAYSGQKAADLPLEPTDQRLDAIVTEAETRVFG